MNTRSVRKSWAALGLCSAAALSLGTSASAQDAAKKPETPEVEKEVKMEKFEVTGSRLSAAAVEGALPTVSYNAEELASSGSTTLVDYLKTLPFSGGAGTIGSNFTNGGNGTTQIALRGLGGENTLVLVNGRRMTPSGTGSAVDLNAIPFSLIEKVEVLKSGGSVVYGTDAVAGVINVILKKNANGGAVNAYYGNTTDTDVAKKVGSFNVGRSTDDFSFIIGASWEEESGMFAPDRDFAIGGGHSGFGNPGRFFFSGAAQAALVAANGAGSSWTLKPGVNVATKLTDFKAWNNTDPRTGGDRFPFENFTTMVNPNSRYNVYTNFEHDIVGKRIRLFGDVNYADTHSEFQLAPSPFSAANPIPATNYWNQQIFGAAAGDIDNGYRFADFAPRWNVVDRSVFRLIAGLRGEVTDSIKWESSWLYSEEKTNDQELNGISQPRLDAINGTNTPADYNWFTRSYNPQAGTFAAGAPYNPASMIDSLRVDSATAVNSKTRIFDVKVMDSNLVELPAGPIEAVVGFEVRKQSVLSKPDDAKLNGSIGWNAADGVTKGTRNVIGGYTELAVPIVHSLSGTLSYRYEKYKNEFNAKVGGVGLRWQAIKNELTIRGNVSQGFVAPSLLDIYNPGFESFPEIVDPRFPLSDPNRLYQISANYVGSVAGGAALQPEKSKIYSLGFTYSPKFLKGFEVTVDYSKIDQENIIVYSVQSIIREWARTGGPAPTAAFANRITLANDPTAPNGVVIDSLIGIGPRNVALRSTEYVDVEMSYTLPVNRFGRFVVGADATRYLAQEETNEVGGLTTPYLGVFDGDVAYPKWKGRVFTRWKQGAFNAALTGNYMGRVVDETEARDKLESDWTIDGQVGYKLPWGGSRYETTLTVGARNVLDNPPPTSPGAFSNNYAERSYDARGRFLYLKLDQTF